MNRIRIDASMQPGRTAARRPFWNNKRREQAAGWLFVAPELIGLIALSVFPLLFSFALGFTNWNLVGGLSAIEFVGLDNFKALLHDDKFAAALRNNAFFTAVTVPIGILVALLMAAAIHARIYFKPFFKIVFFIPYVCSTVAIAAVWSALFHPSLGPLNQMLGQLGVENPPKWLVDTTFALVAVMIIYVWQNIGYQIVIFIAGLSSIPEELYEAAGIDGATGWQQFRHITIPLLGPTTFFLTITSIIASFKVFDIIKFLTGGGPNYASTVIVYQIYEEGFQRFNMGYASAMSWALFLVIVVVSSVTSIIQRRSAE